MTQRIVYMTLPIGRVQSFNVHPGTRILGLVPHSNEEVQLHMLVDISLPKTDHLALVVLSVHRDVPNIPHIAVGKLLGQCGDNFLFEIEEL